MKRALQGFTLIELLLVLAIIGIISAIAIPALISQRSRARDKASTHNLVSEFNDLQGQYDKARDLSAADQTVGGAAWGEASILAFMQSHLASATARDPNPWQNGGPAFDSIQQASGYMTLSAFLSGMAGGSNAGTVTYTVQFHDSVNPGYLGGTVRLAEQDTAGNPVILTKGAGLD
jgi:prepilin-type N-terminal cleavage/methylation domain-containing protein